MDKAPGAAVAGPEEPTSDATLGSGRGRLPMLDGWRAISILLVLAGHMLPLGPASWAMNAPVAALGMAVFFNLSGFLIVSILWRGEPIRAFLVRRLARIVPLAWTVIILVLALGGADRATWLANLFFYANLPPFYLDFGGHLWSLDLEMQFYAMVALLVAVLGRRGLWLLPFAAVAITIGRIAMGKDISIVTWSRLDEILAGCILALVVYAPRAATLRRHLAAIPFLPILALFVLSTRPELPALNYIRPYLAATMVGITILRPIGWLSPTLESRPLRYLARVSYAVYVIHPYSQVGWLGSGHGVAKYVKRPLCFAITFALAHVSTVYLESPINRWAHRRTAGPAGPPSRLRTG